MSLKDDVLSELSETEYVSGEELAEKFGVSRNSVWKAVNQLRQQGNNIEAVTNKGYHLLTEPDLDEIDKDYILNNITGDWKEIITFKKTKSTNEEAKQIALSGEKGNRILIADKQLGGKGRKGRVFFSPDKKGLYMSILLTNPDIKVEDATLITSYTAVATAKAVEKLCGNEVKIKWVNDLYMNDKKICGILTEAGFDFESGTVDYVIIGIGINTLKSRLPKEIKDIATSIENETGVKIFRNNLVTEIVNGIVNMPEALKTKDFLNTYREKSNVIGRNITVYYGNRVYNAKAVDIDDNAALVVETGDGIETVNSGEVSIRLWKQRI